MENLCLLEAPPVLKKITLGTIVHLSGDPFRSYSLPQFERGPGLLGSTLDGIKGETVVLRPPYPALTEACLFGLKRSLSLQTGGKGGRCMRRRSKKSKGGPRLPDRLPNSSVGVLQAKPSCNCTLAVATLIVLTPNPPPPQFSIFLARYPNSPAFSVSQTYNRAL